MRISKNLSVSSTRNPVSDFFYRKNRKTVNLSYRYFPLLFCFSSNTAFTSSACPFTETLRQTATMIPPGLIRNVSRWVPKNSLPNIVLGFHES